MESELRRIIFKLSPNQKMNFLNGKELFLEKDILNIASIIFNIETAIKLGFNFNEVIIPISKETSLICDLDEISKQIEDLLTYVLVIDIDIKFDVQDLTKYRRYKRITFTPCHNVCLFSGGVDSFSGILNSHKFYKDIRGVSVLHGDLSWVSHIINDLYQNFNFIVFQLYAPRMGSRGYSQLRGALYMLYGIIYISLLKANNLIITECGPTMYQPKFSPMDTVTMTTHPFVMTKIKTISELLLNREIEFTIPYENLTKAEVISVSPKKQLLKKTHSCISARFGRNEGTCYGCTIRRLGEIVAGVNETPYIYNPIIDNNSNADNLLQLLRFSRDILLRYESMNFTPKEMIYIYNKHNLFHRFALDNIAAIYLTEKQNRLSRKIIPLYRDIIDNIDKETIEDRIIDVRNRKFKPDFTKTV